MNIHSYFNKLLDPAKALAPLGLLVGGIAGAIGLVSAGFSNDVVGAGGTFVTTLSAAFGAAAGGLITGGAFAFAGNRLMKEDLGVGILGLFALGLAVGGIAGGMGGYSMGKSFSMGSSSGEARYEAVMALPQPPAEQAAPEAPAPQL